jgi:hypothetical protein
MRSIVAGCLSNIAFVPFSLSTLLKHFCREWQYLVGIAKQTQVG